MEVTITLTICLSVVFVITLGIVSCTLRDKNFKVRFDDRNKRLMRIIEEQRNELHSYREAIKKNDANLEKSLEVLASASDVINNRIFRLKDTEELLSKVKVELGDLNLGTDKVSKKMDEAIRSFSSCVKKIENNNGYHSNTLNNILSIVHHIFPQKRRSISINICYHVPEAIHILAICQTKWT